MTIPLDDWHLKSHEGQDANTKHGEEVALSANRNNQTDKAKRAHRATIRLWSVPS